MVNTAMPQPCHPAAQDRLPTKQGGAWSVPKWEKSGEN